MKLHEEFREYETMWELEEDASEPTKTSGSAIWTTPDGRKINLNSNKEVDAEVKRWREQRVKAIEQSVNDSEDSNEITQERKQQYIEHELAIEERRFRELLRTIRYFLNRDGRAPAEVIAKIKEENQKIVDKLYAAEVCYHFDDYLSKRVILDMLNEYDLEQVKVSKDNKVQLRYFEKEFKEFYGES